MAGRSSDGLVQGYGYDDSDDSDLNDLLEESESDDESVAEEVMYEERGGFLGRLRGPKKVVEVEDNTLYSLVWSKIVTTGTPPSPRQGHTMTAIGNDLYVFGGSNGKRSFDTLYILETATMHWKQPQCSGTVPKPRQRHAAVALPNRSLMVWGGIGGGSEVYMLETSSFTWFQARVTGEPPRTRWGHSMVIVSQSVLVLGGHDGKDSLDEVHELDLTSMSWNVPFIKGDAPVLGARHTSGVRAKGERTVCVGGPEQGSFYDVYVYKHDKARWTTVETSGEHPPSRARHVSEIVNNNLFLFGGVGGGRAMNDVRVLELHQKPPHWQRPVISGIAPSSRYDHAMTLIKDRQGTRMIVFGGNDGIVPLNDVYALVTMTWSEAIPRGIGQPAPRIGCTLTVVADKIFMIGGSEGGAPQNDVRVFHTDTEEWSIPPITGHPPTAVVGHSTVCVGLELLVFGGGNGKTDGNALMIYDTSISAWEDPPTDGVIPVARYGHAAVLFRQKMYTFGGYSVKVGYSNDLYMLDVTSMRWVHPYVNGAKPRERVGHTMTLVGHRIFIYGGSNTDEVFDDIFTLDLNTMTWSKPQQSGDERLIPPPRFNHMGCLCGTKIFFYGGLVKTSDVGGRKVVRENGWKRHGWNCAVNKLHVLDTDKMVWEEPVVAGRGPGPRFRHGVVSVGTKAYVFGGRWGGDIVYVLETGMPAPELAGVARKKRGAYQKEEQADKFTVLDWLRELGLERYARSFVKSEIDWESILELNDVDLKMMGIIALGPRKKLLTAIEKKKQAQHTIDLEEELPDESELYKKRFKMERVINYGPLSSVSLAIDLTTNKNCVLKYVNNKDDFWNEVTMLRDLRSEYVVDMIEFYEDEEGDSHCIVLDYAVMDLAQYIKNNKLDRNERKYILDRCGRILEHFHNRNVVHCDFKPSNVCLFGTQWKAIDLGNVRKFGTKVPGSMTPMYASPEWAKAIKFNKLSLLKATPGMDVWSLGIIIVEAFTRRHYLRSDKPDTMTTLNGFEKVSLPQDLIDDPQAVHLLSKMLEKNVANRVPIRAVLRHAFFVGGMDTEQLDAAFTYLNETQETLQNDLHRLTLTIDEQSDMERNYIKKIAEQRALEKKLAALQRQNRDRAVQENNAVKENGDRRATVQPSKDDDAELAD